jgi:hypothetical protein
VWGTRTLAQICRTTPTASTRPTCSRAGFSRRRVARLPPGVPARPPAAAGIGIGGPGGFKPTFFAGACRSARAARCRRSW